MNRFLPAFLVALAPVTAQAATFADGFSSFTLLFETTPGADVTYSMETIAESGTFDGDSSASAFAPPSAFDAAFDPDGTAEIGDFTVLASATLGAAPFTGAFAFSELFLTLTNNSPDDIVVSVSLDYYIEVFAETEPTAPGAGAFADVVVVDSRSEVFFDEVEALIGPDDNAADDRLDVATLLLPLAAGETSDEYIITAFAAAFVGDLPAVPLPAGAGLLLAGLGGLALIGRRKR